jgi:hydrogenase expression/formation protein HypC
MCLAIPGRIERVTSTPEGDRVAEVDFDGERRTVHLLYLPEAQVGDYVVVHARFATTLVPEAEALEAQRLARSLPPSTPAQGSALGSPGSSARA